MGDITSGCTITEGVPAGNFKVYAVKTAATADGGDTISMSGYIKTIYGARINRADGAATASATWSGTTVTIPATGGTNKTFYMLVWGVD